MGDAEWMYENNLDPLYRKDEDSGELVEWEGRGNPTYEGNGEPSTLYNEGASKVLLIVDMFLTFEDAKAWAKTNPGRSFFRSPDGKGYIPKDSISSLTSCDVKKKNNRKFSNSLFSDYEKKRIYLTREEAEAKKLIIHSIRVTESLFIELWKYISDNDLITEDYEIAKYNKRPMDVHRGSHDTDFKAYDRRPPSSLNWVYFAYTPSFSLKNYSSGLRLISSEDRHGYSDGYSEEIYEDRKKRCKTILDLYFDMLRNNPNDLIDMRFETSSKLCLNHPNYGPK